MPSGNPQAKFSEARLPPAIDIVWNITAPLDEGTLGSALLAFSGAAKLAGVRWPDLYAGAPILRLLVAGVTDNSLLRAAERDGWQIVAYGPAMPPAAQVGVYAVERGEAETVPAQSPAIVFEADGRASFGNAVRNAPMLSGEPIPRDWGPVEREAVCQALLGPPLRRVERKNLLDFLGEDAGQRPWRFAYDILLRLIGEPRPKSTGGADEWAEALAAAETFRPQSANALAALKKEHQRADALAVVYGERWRSTLAARSFLLFLTNLASGLVGVLFPNLAVGTLPIQFAVVVLTYADQRIARARRWRGRWLDYRRLAETLRVSRYLTMAGARLPAIAEPTWVDWRLKAALRQSEPQPPLDDQAAQRFLDYLATTEIGGQIAYHASAYRRFRRLDARLRGAGTFAMIAASVLGLGFAILAVSGLGGYSISFLSAVSFSVGSGPGLHAALNALRAQLDVARQTARSARIGLELRRLRREMSKARPSAATAIEAAERAAAIMLEDVSTWGRVMEIV